MSAMKPRRTPRLSRWPVPRIASSPVSVRPAISADTFHDPISIAVMSFSTLGCAMT